MNHRRNRRALALALALPLAAFAAACSDDEPVDTGSTTTASAGGGDAACSSVTAPEDAPAITIGAQDFQESKILAAIYASCLSAAGFDVSVQDLGGYRDLVVAGFDSGDIDLTAEYAASMLEFLNEDVAEATGDAEETTGLLQGYLDDLGLVALTPSAAVDTNAFVVTQATADELGITTISDLADHTDLVLGAPADCESNPFCLPGLDSVYGIDLSGSFTALEASAVSAALDSGDIQVGVLFSTNSIIVENEYVLLDDDEAMLAADNILPVLTADLAEVDGIAELLDAISAALTTENVTELNRRFDIDLEDPEDIADDFLATAGLL